MTHKQRSSTRSGKAHSTAPNGPQLHQEHRSRNTTLDDAADYPDISVSLEHADRVSRNFPLLERRVERTCALLNSLGGSANVRAAAALAHALDSVKAPLLMGKIIVGRTAGM